MPSAAILTGGEASRFGGRDKSALVLGGRTILERQLAELSRLTDDILIVGAAKGGRRPGSVRWPAPTLTSCLRDGITLRMVVDGVPGCGPLGGLDASLAAARDDQVVILACDMPFVTASLIEHLLALVPGSDVVVPRTERGYHPLCAVYTRGCRAVVSRRLAERRLAITGVLEELRVRVVTAKELGAFGDPDHLLANVNTPAEYEELEALQDHYR